MNYVRHLISRALVYDGANHELATGADEWEKLLRDSGASNVSTKLIVALEQDWCSGSAHVEGLEGRDAEIVSRLRSSARFGFVVAVLERRVCCSIGRVSGSRQSYDLVYESRSEGSDHVKERSQRAALRIGSTMPYALCDTGGDLQHCLSTVQSDEVSVVSCGGGTTEANEFVSVKGDVDRLCLNEPVFNTLSIPDVYAPELGRGEFASVFRFRRCVLLVWPLEATFRLRCEADLGSALAKISSSPQQTALGMLEHLFQHLYQSRPVGYDMLVRLLQVALSLRSMAHVCTALRLMRYDQVSQPAVLDVLAVTSKMGVASADAVETLCNFLSGPDAEFWNTVRGGTGSVEQTLVQTIESTRGPHHSHLVAFATRMEAERGTYAPSVQTMSDRLVTWITHTIARSFSIVAAACDQQITRLGLRADAAFVQKAAQKAARLAGYDYHDPRRSYFMGVSNEIQSLASDCVSVGGPVAWCVVREFLPGALLTMRGVRFVADPLLRAAGKVWLWALQFGDGTVPHGDDEDARSAREIVEHMCAAAADDAAPDELLEVMTNGAVRAAVSVSGGNGSAMAYVRPFVRRRVRALLQQTAPVQTWAFSSAQCSKKKVEKFLRGYERRLVLGANGSFRNRGHALRFITRNFNVDCPDKSPLLWARVRQWSPRYDLHNHGFTAMLRSVGRGRRTYVEMVKTDDMYLDQAEQYNLSRRELGELELLMFNTATD